MVGAALRLAGRGGKGEDSRIPGLLIMRSSLPKRKIAVFVLAGTVMKPVRPRKGRVMKAPRPCSRKKKRGEQKDTGREA
jgi:hypothetical protein